MDSSSNISDNQEDTSQERPSIEHLADVESNDSLSSPSNTLEAARSKHSKSNEPEAPGQQTKQSVSGIEASLYYAISNGKASLQVLIDDWINAYTKDKDSAFLQLMQFFINASGCEGNITPEMQNTLEYAAIIEKMIDAFEEETVEYPLMQKGRRTKKFHSRFCDFVQMLVKQCQHSIIYDQYLMDNIISFLSILSTSKVRAFRHTSTLGVLKLLTAVIRVVRDLSGKHRTITTQYDSEKKKSKEMQAMNRLEILQTTLNGIEENLQDISAILAFTFKSVFVHRFKDVASEIRSLCMEELGQWMQMYPEYFVEDSYLKYISWMLFDKCADVRLKCLQVLQPLYADRSLAGHMELFTVKFKDRILFMMLDKETNVSVEAVGIVASIMRHSPDVITEKDCEMVYELVYSRVRPVGRAAGKIVGEKLMAREYDVSHLGAMAGKKITPSAFFLRDIVDFFVESELPDHAICLVDSLIENHDVLKSWKCFTTLLLESDLPKELTLVDVQESALIKILLCCVKYSVAGEQSMEIGQQNEQRLSSRERKQLIYEKDRLTIHFAPRLPLLLNKFITDAEKISNFLHILENFDLRVYTSNRQEKNLEHLLEAISTIVEKHNNTDVLTSVSKALEFLCDEDYSIYRQCDTVRASLLEVLTSNYLRTKEQFFSAASYPNEDNQFNYLSALKKLTAFYLCHNMNSCEIWDSLFDSVLDTFENVTNHSPEMVNCCISACFAGLLWYYNDLTLDLSDSNQTKKHTNDLRFKLDSFMNAMMIILADPKYQVWRNVAFSSVCDLLVAFGVHLEGEQFDSLVYIADKTLQDLITKFISEEVFHKLRHVQSDQAKAEEIFKKRNFLATYCKLVFCQALPMSSLTELFKNYTKEFEEYADIIKETVVRCRSTNSVNCCKTIILTLFLRFQEVQLETENMQISEQYFMLLELTKRFSSMFGLDSKKNSAAMLALHKDGVKFACMPDQDGGMPNILFFEIICEFSNKLYNPDRKEMVTYLDQQVGLPATSSKGKQWRPLYSYRKSLSKFFKTRSSPDLQSSPIKKLKTKTGTKRDRNYSLELRSKIIRPLHNLSLNEGAENSPSLESSMRTASELISEFSD